MIRLKQKLVEEQEEAVDRLLKRYCSQEELNAIFEIRGKKYLRLYRGTSERAYAANLESNGEAQYLNNSQPISCTVDINVAGKFSELNSMYNKASQLVLELFVPVEEIEFENTNPIGLPSRKIFTRNFDLREKEYTAYWQSPVSWIEAYSADGRIFVKNVDFDPMFIPERRPLFKWLYGQENYYGRLNSEESQHETPGELKCQLKKS